MKIEALASKIIEILMKYNEIHEIHYFQESSASTATSAYAWKLCLIDGLHLIAQGRLVLHMVDAMYTIANQPTNTDSCIGCYLDAPSC